jgi:hypothetical protein
MAGIVPTLTAMSAAHSTGDTTYRGESSAENTQALSVGASSAAKTAKGTDEFSECSCSLGRSCCNSTVYSYELHWYGVMVALATRRWPESVKKHP